MDGLAKKGGWEQLPVVLLKTDWNRYFSWKQPMTAAHVRLARQAQDETGGLLERWYHDPHHPAPLRQADNRVTYHVVPAAYLPALARRLRRQLGVAASLHPQERGTIVRVLPQAVDRAEHPSSWLQAFAETDAVFPGLSIYLGADPVLRLAMQDGRCSSRLALDQVREQEVLCISRPREEEKELLVHAVMAGKPATVYLPEQTEPWWEPLAKAGVPVRIIHKRVLPEGESWVSYHL